MNSISEEGSFHLLLLIPIVLGLVIVGVLILSRNTDLDEESSGKKAPSGGISEKVSSPTTAVKTGGIAFGPFFFGERTTDYDFVKDGIKAGDIFTGGMIDVGTKSPSNAKPLFEAARSNEIKLIVSASHPKTCYYWDGTTFDQKKLVSDVEKFLPLISQYQDVVIGINLLDEPHDPSSCPALPAQNLYDAAKEIRDKFSSHGLPQDFPLGYGSPPFYYKTLPPDGTINLSTTSYVPKRGSIESFLTSQEADAQSLGHKLYFYVNGVQSGTNLDDDLVYLCKNANPEVILMIGYWKWDQNGGNQNVPLTDFTKVRDACNAR